MSNITRKVKGMEKENDNVMIVNKESDVAKYETENITAKKLVQDFKSRYDISLTQEGANRILAKYVQSGVLSPRFRHFVFLNC